MTSCGYVEIDATTFADASELMTELAEFGCELQDDVVFSVSTMEATYENAAGKTKTLGPRTTLSEVVEAGEVVVQTKSAALEQQRTKPTRAINGSARLGSAMDDDFELPEKGRAAVAVKVAPRPLR